MSTPTAEVGHVTGLPNWWGAPDDEETPELRWPKNVEIYDRMRRQDGQVISVLRAVTLPIVRTPWRLDPNGARPEVVEFVADNLGLPIVGEEPKAAPRTRDRFSWAEHLRLALLQLTFGHSFFEQVYRLDDAGMLRLRKLAWRPPRTISKVDVARDGGLVAIEQQGAKDTVRMEVDRLVAYVSDREGGNWLGQSLLRPAYKYWLLKDRLLRVGAQTVDRNGLGIPTYTAPESPADLKGEDREKWEKDQVANGLKVAKAMRSGESAGVSLPHGATLKAQGVDGTLPDAEKWVRYYDEQIARAVLAHFLNLGTETGSWALGSTFADFFTLSLQTVGMAIADTANQHIVEDLVDLNWGEDEPAPRITFDEIGSRHPLTAEAIKALVDAKALTPDPGLEQYLRTTFGLPALDKSSGDGMPALSADALRQAAETVGLLSRSGFDPVDSAAKTGLPDIKHTGLLTVSIKDHDEDKTEPGSPSPTEPGHEPHPLEGRP